MGTKEVNVGLTEQGKFDDNGKRRPRNLTPEEVKAFTKTGAMANIRMLTDTEFDGEWKHVCGPSGFTRHTIGDKLAASEPSVIEGYLADGTLQILQICAAWSPKTTLKVATKGYVMKHDESWGKGLTTGERKAKKEAQTFDATAYGLPPLVFLTDDTCKRIPQFLQELKDAERKAKHDAASKAGPVITKNAKKS